MIDFIGMRPCCLAERVKPLGVRPRSLRLVGQLVPSLKSTILYRVASRQRLPVEQDPRESRIEEQERSIDRSIDRLREELKRVERDRGRWGAQRTTQEAT